jgi:hypothetical protein
VTGVTRRVAGFAGLDVPVIIYLAAHAELGLGFGTTSALASSGVE